MDIANVAKRTGMPASKLRFYEEKGLIESVGRDGLRRRFAPDVLDRLSLISLGQAAGLSLNDIGSMLLPHGKFKIDRALLAAKSKEIDETIRRLKAISRGLAHAAVCPAASHAACPSFQKLLRAASLGELPKPSKTVARKGAVR